MPTQPEAALSRRVVKALNARGGFFSKIHGGPFQKKGLPDIVGCYKGRFVGVEVKMPGGIATELQGYRILQIRLAGGVADVVRSVEAALALLDEVDQAVGGSSRR